MSVRQLRRVDDRGGSSARLWRTVAVPSEAEEGRPRTMSWAVPLSPDLELWQSTEMPGRARGDYREKDDERRNSAHRHEGMHQAPTAAVTPPALTPRPGEWMPLAKTPLTLATAWRSAQPSALLCVIVL
jgi:hypothetical protein